MKKNTRPTADGIDALATRLNCPVPTCGAEGKVRLKLGTISPGDVIVWHCEACGQMWSDEGYPMYGVTITEDKS